MTESDQKKSTEPVQADDLDYVLNEVGEFRKHQILHFVLIALPIILASTNAVEFIVTSSTPDYRYEKNALCTRGNCSRVCGLSLREIFAFRGMKKRTFGGAILVSVFVCLFALNTRLHILLYFVNVFVVYAIPDPVSICSHLYALAASADSVC